MIDMHELHSLTRWCASRRLRWQPACTRNGAPAIMLQSHAERRAWSDMMLVAEADEVSLLDSDGQTIAIASDVPALLDALDAGLLCPAPMIDLLPYIARSSDPLWNRSGSAST